MNILFFNQPISEYGQSILYHGLRKLGHYVEPVLRNTFHFTGLTDCDGDCANGPCGMHHDAVWLEGCTRHPSHLTLPTQQRPELLGDEEFTKVKWDLVITNNGIGYEEEHRELIKNGNRIACLDLGDSSQSAFTAWVQVLGQEPDWFFRREFYEQQIGYPLQYAFYEEKSQFRPLEEMEFSVCCLHRPTNPIRAQVGQAVASIPNSFVGEVHHSQYLDIMSKSRFTIALPGAGMDTLRHWEAPGMGSVLTRLPSPLSVLNDFQNGVDCVEFSNLDELVEKINYYLNNSNEEVYLKMRQQSYDKFKEFHTTKARAQQLLNAVFN